MFSDFIRREPLPRQPGAPGLSRSPTGGLSELRARGVTPHVAQLDRRRRSAVDGRTTRHRGYRQSQKRRKIVEQVFGWMKTVGGGRKPRFVRRERNRGWPELTAAACNLVRMARLETAGGVGTVRPPPRPGP